MTHECPCCQSNLVVRLEIATSYEYGCSLIHRGSGAVNPLACLNCGTIFLGLDDRNNIYKTVL